jgi:cysteine-rich repeat protein
MRSRHRTIDLLRAAVTAVAAIAAVAACTAPDRTRLCSSNGETYLCPEDTECGGLQRLCVPPGGCGNGTIDQAEQCDDGNIMPGDGCSPTCLFEVCGNGILDPHEICDDGNTAGGDGCSADCASKEQCGNGIVDRDAGEVCDDGIDDGKGGFTPAKDGDGCSANCRSTEVCGNWIIDRSVGEVCDDGPDGSDRCSRNCRSNLACGNAIVDPGEECDHGLVGENNPSGNSDGNDCRADCQFNRCGDGLIDNQPGQRQEQCDGGRLIRDSHGQPVPFPQDTAACNIDCTNVQCGDGKVNRAAGEQCDDGNTVAGDGCSPQCQFELCRNGALDPQEQCDGALGLQPCNVQTCLQEICGNGVRDDDSATGVHEQCDDGNTRSGDGCSSSCATEFCGDGVTNNGELCDPSDPQFGAARCNTDCTPTHCGDGKLDTAAGEQCDDGNNLNADGCSATCVLERCRNGVLDPGEQCDGALGQQPCNTQTCLQEICGNGIRDNDNATGVHEQCDDGNIADGDGCSATCVRESCGDGATNNGEPCDPSDPQFGPARCNTDCTLTRCGDSKLNLAAGEQCDDGNTASGDGCSATCILERCKNGVLDPGEQCDGALGLQPCNAQTCLQERCGNGMLDNDNATGVHEQCDDGNNLGGDGCSATCALERCGNNVLDPGEQCDGLLGLQPCNTLTCLQEACGNGILDNDSATGVHEQCDDGNNLGGDGCSSTCVRERCGNDVLDPGEQCDGLLGLQPCNTLTCLQEACGNGVLDNDTTTGVHEQCDDGNNLSGDGCSAACRFEVCGNGVQDPGEDCDDGALNNGVLPSTCSTTCHRIACGNGIVEQGEGCDDHNQVTEICPYGAAECTVCDATCKIAAGETSRCGDGRIDAAALELCDDGNTSCGGCSSDCRAITSSPATGSLVIPSADFIRSGDSFVLSDGQRVAVFEFTIATTVGTALDVLAISVDPGESSASIADKIIARLAATALQITAAPDASLPDNTTRVRLTHQVATARGNQPIASAFAVAGFQATGMSGGAGADCATGQACTQDLDCASNVCDHVGIAAIGHCQ